MNEQIENLESQLEDMSVGKRIFIYVVIFISCVYMSWSMFGEEMNSEIKVKEDSITKYRTKLQKNNIKSLEKVIKKIKKENLILEEEVTNLDFKDKYVKSKLESIGFIYYNEKGMAKILDDILKNSVQNQIDIKFITSNEKKGIYSPYILEKESISISGIGRFKNILSLVQYIDSFNTLLRIDSLAIYLDDNQTTSFDINISEYGVEL